MELNTVPAAASSVPAVGPWHPLPDGSFGRLIGFGGSAEVFAAQRPSGGFGVLKIGKDQAAKDEILDEARLLTTFSHENILRVIQWPEGGLPMFDLCEGGDLARVKTTTRVEWMRWAQQVAAALGHLHARKVLHRDIKPNNIFLKSNGAYQDAIIGDFGLALYLEEDQAPPQKMLAGTSGFIASEVLRGCPFSFPSDMWSWGVTFFELAMRVPGDVNRAAKACVCAGLRADPDVRPRADVAGRYFSRLAAEDPNGQLPNPPTQKETELYLDAERAIKRGREAVARCRGRKDKGEEVRQAEQEEADHFKRLGLDVLAQRQEEEMGNEVYQAEKQKADAALALMIALKICCPEDKGEKVCQTEKQKVFPSADVDDPNVTEASFEAGKLTSPAPGLAAISVHPPAPALPTASAAAPSSSDVG